jgi:hypothetical protein
MLRKKDIQITYENENCYRVSIRKKFLLIFPYWYILTYLDRESGKEKPLEFKTFEDSVNFIETITQD